MTDSSGAMLSRGPDAQRWDLFLPVCCILLASACFMDFMAGYAGDKTWLLLAARMWVQGRTLDVDIIEVNPPLIVWIYGAAAWISRQLPLLHDYNVVALMGMAASALSAWLSLLLIRLHPAFVGDGRARRDFVLLLLMLFIFFTQPSFFFDREHILFVCTFPYLLRFSPSLAVRPLGLRLRLLIGLLAALGFCIKPYTIIVFAGLQLTVLLQQRSAAILTSVENAVIYACAAAYLICVWHFTPDYITTVLPMALATYSAFNRRAIGFFYTIFALITAGTVFADFRPRHQSPYRRDVYHFAGIAFSMLLYALANNGWNYTYHPLFCMLLYLAGWVGFEHAWLKRDHAGRGLPVKQFVFGTRACALVLLLNALYMLWGMKFFYTTDACEWSAECKKNQPYLQYLSEHHIHSFGAITENFHKWASLARLSGADLETRYNALWMVPQLVLKGEDFTRQHYWIVETVGRGLADDLNRRKPPIVFVDDSREFFGTTENVFLPGFFSSVPEFREAWSHYRYLESIDRCAADSEGGLKSVGCHYDIYGRQP